MDAGLQNENHMYKGRLQVDSRCSIHSNPFTCFRTMRILFTGEMSSYREENPEQIFQSTNKNKGIPTF